MSMPNFAMQILSYFLKEKPLKNNHNYQIMMKFGTEDFGKFHKNDKLCSFIVIYLFTLIFQISMKR